MNVQMCCFRELNADLFFLQVKKLALLEGKHAMLYHFGKMTKHETGKI